LHGCGGQNDKDQLGLVVDDDAPQLAERAAGVLHDGSEWIHGLDELPPPVRRRLAESVFNICPTCVDIDARNEASARGLRGPTIAVYFDVIAAVERQLGKQP
jgi:hypothetical protein